MREKMVLNVQEGGTLQVTFGNSPVGQPIAIPQGTKSVTVIVRDTEGREQTRVRRAERRGKRRGGATTQK